MRLTKKQADRLLAAMEGLHDPENIVDPLHDLTSDGTSDDRAADTQRVQEALTEFLRGVAAVTTVAQAIGLDVGQGHEAATTP
jgi:hypothetical protein